MTAGYGGRCDAHNGQHGVTFDGRCFVPMRETTTARPTWRFSSCSVCGVALDLLYRPGGRGYVAFVAGTDQQHVHHPSPTVSVDTLGIAQAIAAALSRDGGILGDAARTAARIESRLAAESRITDPGQPSQPVGRTRPPEPQTEPQAALPPPEPTRVAPDLTSSVEQARSVGFEP